MKTGTTYTGNIHHQDENAVFIVQGSELIKIQAQDIAEIQKDKKQNINKDLDLENQAKEEEKNNEIILKLGYDFLGKYTHKGHSISDKNEPQGLNFSAEYYRYFIDEFGAGIGASIQNSRNIGNIPGKFYFLPVYISAKLRSVPTVPYKYGYAVAQLGYNAFITDSNFENVMDNTKGGVYYACGFGFVYNKIVFEILYSVNSGRSKFQNTNSDIDIEYTKYTLSAGYAF